MVVGFVCSSNLRSYVGDSVATGRASFAGLILGGGYSIPPSLWVGRGLPNPKKVTVTKYYINKNQKLKKRSSKYRSLKEYPEEDLGP